MCMYYVTMYLDNILVHSPDEGCKQGCRSEIGSGKGKIFSRSLRTGNRKELGAPDSPKEILQNSHARSRQNAVFSLSAGAVNIHFANLKLEKLKSQLISLVLH